MITEEAFRGGAEHSTATTKTLTQFSNRVQIRDCVSGDTTLPDARTLKLGGMQFIILKEQATSHDVKDADGTTLATIPGRQAASCSLAANDDAAGSWIVEVHPRLPEGGIDFVVLVDSSVSMSAAALTEAHDLIANLAIRLTYNASFIKGRVAVYHGFLATPSDLLSITKVQDFTSDISEIQAAADVVDGLSLTASSGNGQYAQFFDWMDGIAAGKVSDHIRFIMLGDGGSVATEIPTGIGTGSATPTLATLKAAFDASGVVPFFGLCKSGAFDAAWETAIESNSGDNFGSLGAGIGDTRTNRFQDLTSVSASTAAQAFTDGARV